MNFDIPKELQDYLNELDLFIANTIKPLENQDDNIRFFDHRREDARTDWERGGLPNEEWEALLAKAKRLADDAGHYRYPLPKEYGGQEGTNLGMAIIREHFATMGEKVNQGETRKVKVQGRLASIKPNLTTEDKRDLIQGCKR
jgi:alkylation response protein AidB-like acyl-CoA dehydrogenase